MRDIAREAGCSVETVYSSAGNKPTLLKTVLDIAVVGDDAEVPLDDRPWFRVDPGDSLEARVAAATEIAASIYRRTAALRRVLDFAAQGNPELADLDAKARSSERISRAALAAETIGRPLTDVEADSIQAVFSTEIYFAFTERSGWTHEQYQSWAADALIRLFDLHEE